ncbi:MAG: GNAT family N-acetyltransferase [Candidatus Lokiarchaeota archaeon]|nr:GNAT family N-acetyltransferase [Candidatus Lokiarchaeota archaeon]
MKNIETRGRITIEIARDPRISKKIGHFFVDNVDPSYISHSELQIGRAISPTAWAPDIERMIAEEFEQIIKESIQDGKKYILLATEADSLVGFALVETYVENGFSVIPDMITKREKRGLGIGGKLLDWVDNDLKTRGIHRIFLESGLNNENAHEFFKKHHYKAVSKVFMKDLLAP